MIYGSRKTSHEFPGVLIVALTVVDLKVESLGS